MVEPIAGLFGAAAVVVSVLWIRGLVSKKNYGAVSVGTGTNCLVYQQS